MKLTKKQAVKGMTRDQSLLPGYMKRNKGITRNQAMGTHKDLTSVTPGAQTSIGSVGTTVGSNNPQAPDQDSVLKKALRARVAKPPRATEQDTGAIRGVQPPGSPTTAAESRGPVNVTAGPSQNGPQNKAMYQHVKKKLQGRSSFK